MTGSKAPQDPINLQYTTIKDPLPDFIYEDLKEFTKNANGYKPQPPELVEKLAEKHHLPKEMIYLTVGIDEAIQMFIRAFGQHTHVFTPTYIVYADAEIFGNKMTRIDAFKNGTYSIEPKNFPEATLIFLANPNNPSGITQPEVIEELIKLNPQAKVVIDEAYGQFAPELSSTPLLNKYKNLSVLRSFSKDYSMAGNRIGYIISQPETIAGVKDMSQWASTSYLSVGAAMSALNHEDYFTGMREDIKTRREDLNKFLVDGGFTVVPSGINALLLKFADEEIGSRFYQHLLDNNITTSHGNGNSNIGLDKSFVRIAIGTKEQIGILKKIINTFA